MTPPVSLLFLWLIVLGFIVRFKDTDIQKNTAVELLFISYKISARARVIKWNRTYL